MQDVEALQNGIRMDIDPLIALIQLFQLLIPVGHPLRTDRGIIHPLDHRKNDLDPAVQNCPLYAKFHNAVSFTYLYAMLICLYSFPSGLSR